jgi:hypothetical protein
MHPIINNEGIRVQEAVTELYSEENIHNWENGASLADAIRQTINGREGCINRTQLDLLLKKLGEDRKRYKELLKADQKTALNVFAMEVVSKIIRLACFKCVKCAKKDTCELSED